MNDAAKALWTGIVSLSVAVRSPARRARAMEVADRLGVPWVPSSSREAASARARYAISEHRERIVYADGAVLEPNPGLLGQKLQAGRAHPLIRAVLGCDARTVLDGTAGLLQDALHLAALGAEVCAVEASPALAYLLEAAVERWRVDHVGDGATHRLTVQHGSFEETLLDLEPGAVDAIYLDPMFQTPRKAAPGYCAFRREATHRNVAAGALGAATRIARQRVVLKVPAASLPTLEGDWREVGFNRRVCARAFDFWIVEKDPAYRHWDRPKRRRAPDPCPAPPAG